MNCHGEGLHDWKRFWCRPEGRINLSDEGFLVDPEAEYGAALNPDVVLDSADSKKTFHPETATQADRRAQTIGNMRWQN